MTVPIVPPGTSAAIQLFRVSPTLGPDRFEAASLLPSPGPGPGGTGLPAMPTVLEGSPGVGNPVRELVGVGNSNLQIRQASGPGDGFGLLFTLGVPYLLDPTQLQSGNRVVARNTGGRLNVANPAYDLGAIANDDGQRLGQDVRAFLYAQDADTDTQAIRLVADANGRLRVDTAIVAATDVANQADFTTLAATVSSLIAENTARTQAIIQNLSSVASESVRIGNSSISVTQGIRVAPGETITLDTTAEIFIIPESGTPDVARAELGGAGAVVDTMTSGALGNEVGFNRFGAAPPQYGLLSQDFPNPPGGGLQLQEITQDNNLSWDIRFEGNGIAQGVWTTLTLETTSGIVVLNSAAASIFNPNFGTSTLWVFGAATADILFANGAGTPCTYVFT